MVTKAASLTWEFHVFQPVDRNPTIIPNLEINRRVTKSFHHYICMWMLPLWMLENILILRDRIQGFQRRTYGFNPLHAELTSIKEGLQLAIEENVQNLKICSESKTAIEKINSGATNKDIYLNIVQVCRELSKFFQVAESIWIRVEDNELADLLAKRDHCLDVDVN